MEQLTKEQRRALVAKGRQLGWSDTHRKLLIASFVDRDPSIQGGVPVIRGTRIPMEGSVMRQFRIAPMEPTDLIELDPSAGYVAPKRQFFCLDTVTGEVWITSCRQCDNAVPMRVWHGFVREWEIPYRTDAQKLAEAVNAGELDALLTRIMEGAETIWDGNNHVRRFNEDAQLAAEEVERWFEGWEGTVEGGLWDAGDYYQYCPPEEVRADSTDEELDALAERLEEEAKKENVVLAHAREYLGHLRDQLRAASGE